LIALIFYFYKNLVALFLAIFTQKTKVLRRPKKGQKRAKKGPFLGFCPKPQKPQKPPIFEVLSKTPKNPGFGDFGQNPQKPRFWRFWPKTQKPPKTPKMRVFEGPQKLSKNEFLKIMPGFWRLSLIGLFAGIFFENNFEVNLRTLVFALFFFLKKS
jgi:hypothetical protein